MCSSDRQHLVHGGERGPAGPDGADRHLRPGSLRRLLQFQRGRRGARVTTARYETWRHGFTPALTSSFSAQGHNKSEDVVRHGLFRHVLEGLEAKSRMSSTSSSSSSDSQTNGSDGDAPAARSAGEGTHTGTLKRRAAPAETEKARSQTPSTPS